TSLPLHRPLCVSVTNDFVSDSVVFSLLGPLLRPREPNLQTRLLRVRSVILRAVRRVTKCVGAALRAVAVVWLDALTHACHPPLPTSPPSILAARVRCKADRPYRRRRDSHCRLLS